ncbi:hypothetical protein BGZ98_003262 [Dissophora globulifera]|nr:hypothetical protein BGZ98_003262 [Dissophora globulifera]
MKNLVSVLLIATLTVASSVSAQAASDADPQAVANAIPQAVPQADVEASMPQEALWNKKRRKHCHHEEKDHSDYCEKHFPFVCDDACLTECLFDERECRDLCTHKVKACSGTCRELRGKCGLQCQEGADGCNALCATAILNCETSLMSQLSALTSTASPIVHILIPDASANLICTATTAADCLTTCNALLASAQALVNAAAGNTATDAISKICTNVCTGPYFGGGSCKAACDGTKLQCEKTCDNEDHDCEKECLFKDDKCERGCTFLGHDCKDRCRDSREDRRENRYPRERFPLGRFPLENGLYPLENGPFPGVDNMENTASPV